MSTDIGQTNTLINLQNSLRAAYTISGAKGQVPGFDWADRIAHWALRIPLAGLLFYYAMQKFPAVFVAPGDYGVPALLFRLAAFAEVIGAIALIPGGFLKRGYQW